MKLPKAVLMTLFQILAIFFLQKYNAQAGVLRKTQENRNEKNVSGKEILKNSIQVYYIMPRNIYKNLKAMKYALQNHNPIKTDENIPNAFYEVNSTNTYSYGVNKSFNDSKREKPERFQNTRIRTISTIQKLANTQAKKSSEDDATKQKIKIKEKTKKNPALVKNLRKKKRYREIHQQESAKNLPAKPPLFKHFNINRDYRGYNSTGDPKRDESIKHVRFSDNIKSKNEVTNELGQFDITENTPYSPDRLGGNVLHHNHTTEDELRDIHTKVSTSTAKSTKSEHETNRNESSTQSHSRIDKNNILNHFLSAIRMTSPQPELTDNITSESPTYKDESSSKASLPENIIFKNSGGNSESDPNNKTSLRRSVEDEANEGISEKKFKFGTVNETKTEMDKEVVQFFEENITSSNNESYLYINVSKSEIRIIVPLFENESLSVYDIENRLIESGFFKNITHIKDYISFCDWIKQCYKKHTLKIAVVMGSIFLVFCILLCLCLVRKKRKKGSEHSDDIVSIKKKPAYKAVKQDDMAEYRPSKQENPSDNLSSSSSGELARPPPFRKQARKSIKKVDYMMGQGRKAKYHKHEQKRLLDTSSEEYDAKETQKTERKKKRAAKAPRTYDKSKYSKESKESSNESEKEEKDHKKDEHEKKKAEREIKGVSKAPDKSHTISDERNQKYYDESEESSGEYEEKQKDSKKHKHKIDKYPKKMQISSDESEPKLEKRYPQNKEEEDNRPSIIEISDSDLKHEDSEIYEKRKKQKYPETSQEFSDESKVKIDRMHKHKMEKDPGKSQVPKKDTNKKLKDKKVTKESEIAKRQQEETDNEEKEEDLGEFNRARRLSRWMQNIFKPARADHDRSKSSSQKSTTPSQRSSTEVDKTYTSKRQRLLKFLSPSRRKKEKKLTKKLYKKIIAPPVRKVISDSVSSEFSAEISPSALNRDELKNRIVRTGDCKKIDDMLVSGDWDRSFYTAHDIDTISEKGEEFQNHDPNERRKIDVARIVHSQGQILGTLSRDSSMHSLQSAIGKSIYRAESAASSPRAARNYTLRNT